VQEMTRFGMTTADFQQLAQLMADVILKNQNVKEAVRALRQRFLEMKYCFAGDQFDDLVERLHRHV
jgi:glycine/serine hydroxymethyltransferase